MSGLETLILMLCRTDSQGLATRVRLRHNEAPDSMKSSLIMIFRRDLGYSKCMVVESRILNIESGATSMLDQDLNHLFRHDCSCTLSRLL
jgi:hypothetical protein